MPTIIDTVKLLKSLSDNAEKEAEARNEVYLGVAGLALKYGQWRDFGAKKIFVFKKTVTELEDGQVGEGSNDEPDPVVCVCVARIGAQDTWLGSDANWTGPSQYTKTFAHVTLATGLENPASMPEGEPFGPHWGPVCAQVTAIMQSACDGKPITSGGPEDRRLVARHALFQVLPEDETERQQVLTDIAQKPAFFDIKNWPVFTDQAKADIRAIYESHMIMPLPAFDSEEKIIEPLQYRAALTGSLAIVSFRIVGWVLKRTRRFRCEIVNIDVLKPSDVERPKRTTPASSSRSPSKRLRA
uniref:Expressed protein n=1 Tax=Schizophyllum commune (strain H4-8 / FGSC 9210) TaxID=578458 RepID=D8PLM8_SCHCM